MLNQIIQGDCLEVMGEIPDQTIDLILCDLPYAQGSTGLDWDKQPIDPIRLWEHYERLIKPNGAIILKATMPFGAMLITQKLDWFKYDLIWSKNNLSSPGIVKYRPSPTHESLLIFSPNKVKITYNPQMREGFKQWVKVNNKAKTENYQNRAVKYGYKEKPLKEGLGDLRYPISILEYAKVNYPDHPNEMPLGLAEWLIRSYSNPGETVLDNCSGSGAIAHAAYNTGRNFYAIEKDPGYFAIACKRLDEIRTQTRFEEMVG